MKRLSIASNLICKGGVALDYKKRFARGNRKVSGAEKP